MNAFSLATTLGLSLALVARLSADPFADVVVNFTPGTGAGFGQDHFPQSVLGPPNGGPSDFDPQQAATDLLSFGHGGQITLAFTDNIIGDGLGVDFIIFENALVNPVSGDPFIEAATVEVSDDGTTWHQFPFDFIPPPDPVPPAIFPEFLASNYPHGFAGLTPVRSNSTNGVDPTDPGIAGGDAFDLADVGLLQASFVRITDAGLFNTPTQRMDSDGDVLRDDGDYGAVNAGDKRGFDLDAVAVIHTEAPTAAMAWQVYR